MSFTLDPDRDDDLNRRTFGDHFGTTYRMADALLRTITYIVQPDGSVVALHAIGGES